MTRRVLEGIVVLELGQVYNVPYCALLLAHLGADVIKIEPPLGEPARHRAAGAESAPFLMLNAGKQGMRIDLKTAAGRAVFLRLVETCDVVVENYRAGTLDKLGLDYATLRSSNPALILASGRGFSSQGPYGTLAAMDLTVQAMTGVLATTGFPDQPPVKAGPAVADFLGGIHLCAGILAALLQRQQTRQGQVVEVAMQDALLPSLASNLGALIDSNGELPERTGNRHSGLGICPYNTYLAQDGWVAVFCSTNRHWLVLCDVLERPDLRDDPTLRDNTGRAARMDAIDAIVGGWTLSRSRAECLDRLGRAGIPAAPVLTLKEVINDPQIEASGMFQTVRHPRKGEVRVFGNPLHLSSSPPRQLEPAPALGEHTRTVLRERLHLSEQEIDRLAADGAI
ncbi:MAG TPA: CoA transferase [Chloroflexota bacterium]|nr:CoA transferase [Chloroflexota bacterium]